MPDHAERVHPDHVASLLSECRACGRDVERLGEAVATPHHRFWPDDLSILDATVGDRTRIHGPRQVTDVYLLALAVRHRGRFVSFDAGIPLAAVHGAERKHLVGL